MLALLAALAVVPIGGASADHIKLTGIEGQVLDATCYGPCVQDPKLPPYMGRATVIVRERSSGEIYARVPVVESKFMAHVPPGKYRVRVRPKPDSSTVTNRFRRCWQGSAKNVRVGPGETAYVELTVENVCIQ
jgi:hypothetical protein